MKNRIIKIAISAGDPAGIGPEVTLKALRELLPGSGILPVVIARADILQKYFPDHFREYKIISDYKDLSEIKIDNKYILDIPSGEPLPTPGSGSVKTGLESRVYIDKAVDLWKHRLVDAIVTAPVSKAFIEKSGTAFSGHTEYIAGLIGEDSPYMMMFSSAYRVILASTHIPVSEIPSAVNAEKLYSTVKAGYRAISEIDRTKDLKIAVAGMDPHCGDEGAIGNFDSEITTRVVERLKKEGIDIRGPFAADTLFTPDTWKKYNLAVAHYHDQGLIPFKALAFETGVNVTLGLSITRTSPDHGTAYDIAGQNKAGYKSMLEAIKLAARLIERP